MSNDTAGGARVTEHDLSKLRIIVWSQARQRPFLLLPNLLTASKRPHNSCPVLAARCRSSQCPQTPRCQHQWVLSRQSTSKPFWSSPSAQAQALVPQLIQGRSASEFQEIGAARDPDHGSAATRRHLLHFTYEFVVLASHAVSGGKWSNSVDSCNIISEHIAHE